MDEEYTVSQVARIIGKSDNTIRNWTKILQDELSSGITGRDSGDERKYNEHDVRVFQTAAILRDQRKGFDDILAFIESGQFLEPSKDSDTVKPAKIELESKSALQVKVQLQDELLEAANAKISALEEELNRERSARVDAEKETTRVTAERRAELLESEIRFWGQPWHKRLFGRPSTAIVPAPQPPPEPDGDEGG